MQINIDTKAIAGSVTAIIIAYWRMKIIWNELIKIVDPVIKEAEEMAKDKIITKDERRKLAITMLRSAEASGKIKLDWFSRRLALWVLDNIAQKLPDFTLSQDITELANAAKAEIEQQKNGKK